MVEDEPDLRELLTYNLTAAGFKVQATENGTDGLEAVQRFAPDVVLLDLDAARHSGNRGLPAHPRRHRPRASRP